MEKREAPFFTAKTVRFFDSDPFLVFINSIIVANPLIAELKVFDSYNVSMDGILREFFMIGVGL
jgi:hypothetical protein